MQVTLYDATQAQLNVYNPGTLLSSIVDTSLNAGTYYIKVEGRGNIYAHNYASLGSYSLQGNYFTSTLPLRRLELSGAVVNEKHRLNWFIDADEQVVEQVLEFTTNGRNFISLSSPAAADRLYLYTPMGNNAVQYRLKVTFDNGRTYYSNVITLRNVGTDNRPKLLTNLVNGTITVTSPGSYSYEVVDFTGKQTAKGQLSKGMNYIPASAMASGMYVIRFSDQSNQWTDKLVRQ